MWCWKSAVVALQVEKEDNKTVQYDLVKHLNDLETYSRRENLIITGLLEGKFAKSGTRSADASPTDPLQEGSSQPFEQTIIAFVTLDLTLTSIRVKSQLLTE